MLARSFLAIVGVIYIALALWCAVKPASTARSIGFDLLGGSGLSEYTTVYGGLQLALGLAFLWPLYNRAATGNALALCVLVHAALVAFRTVSLLRFDGITNMTYGFAASEWVVLVLAAGIWWRTTE
jgi:hypothetical protein